MKIEHFNPEDTEQFLGLAASEQWVSEAWELGFFSLNFPQGCFAARTDTGETVGFVTSVRHDCSGWIGNLIVDRRFRGQGIGEELFGRSLEALQSAGVKTCWLTASQSGQRLYEKYGFRRIDTIIRWVGKGLQKHRLHGGHADSGDSIAAVTGIDSQAWGDRREALLEATVNRGELLQEVRGFTAIQPCGKNHQVGPFSALDSETANRIFDCALARIPCGSEFYLDSPASNRSALRIFNRRKLRMSGNTELMYAGARPEYRPGLLYGLATMGSGG